MPRAAVLAVGVFVSLLAGLVLWLLPSAEPPSPARTSSSRTDGVPSREPPSGRTQQRRRAPADENAPDAGAEPAHTASSTTPVSEPTPAKTSDAERRFLGGRTAAEVVKPFADVPARPGLQRFRDDMVPGGPWTQISDLVPEDFDRALDAFTSFALATHEKKGSPVDAQQRRRFEECERAYWPLIADLNRRVSALHVRIAEKDYRDDAERAALETRRSEILGVVERLNRERIAEGTAILTPEPR